MSRTAALSLAATVVLLTVLLPTRADADCQTFSCDEPEVEAGAGALLASYMGQSPEGTWIASNQAVAASPYTYRMINPCVLNDATTGTCRPSDFSACPEVPDRVVEYFIVQQRRLVLPDGTTADGFVPNPGTAPGTEVGPWLFVRRTCVDITALNPPPSPGEVFRYFKELPLPQLTTRQQPPGNGLVGLPVIFFTDSPTPTFQVNIRGFTVDIAATATGFTWHTGDGSDVTSEDAGAPYPDQTVTHDYRSGTYTAYVTTTWSGTYRVNGGASAAVPGTTTTDGPPVTFTVLQARTVLTNPYD